MNLSFGYFGPYLYHMKMIDGKTTANEIKLEIAQEVESMRRSRMKHPHLAAVLV